jgi:phage gpG-like protein
MISAEITGAKRMTAFLDGIPPRVQEILRAEVNRQGLALLRAVKENFLTGQALNVRTGTLRRSINLKVETPAEGEVVGSVGTNLVYARIHELGGQTKPHVITPRAGKVLCFTRAGRAASKSEGNLAFARIVNHPGSKIPARPFLKPALIERTPEIREGLAQAIKRALA